MASYYQPTQQFITSLPSNDKEENEIVTITFKADWDSELETTVIVDDKLSIDSIIQYILEEDVLDDLDTKKFVDEYKFRIQNKSDKKLSLKWSRLKTLREINSTKNCGLQPSNQLIKVI